MPLVVANQVFRLVQSQRYNQEMLCQNVYHFGKTGTAGTAAELGNDWVANIVPGWAQNVHPLMRFLEVSCQQIAPTEDAIERFPLTWTGQNAAATCLPSIAAAVVTWRTQLAGRSRRGRSFIAGWPYDLATQSDGFSWSTAALNRLSTFANLIFARYQLGGNPGAYWLGVWSPKLGGRFPPRDPVKGMTMCVSYTAQAYICAMGKRRMGRGL